MKIIEKMGILRPTRRDILKTGVGLGIGVAASGLAMPAIAQSKPEKLIVSDGGGFVRDAYIKVYYEPFEKKTGIKVVPQAYLGAAEFKAAVDNQAWGQGDVYLLSAAEAGIVQFQGLTENIDYGSIDRKDFFPDMANDGWFLTLVAASCMAWNTDKFPGDKAPKSWADFFGKSEAFKGPRTLYKNATLTMDVAALGDGVTKDQLYPLNIDRAIAALDRIKDELIWWDSGSQSQEVMVSGSADLGFMWNGRAQQLITQKKPIAFTFKDAVLDGDAFAIPKGHPNTKWAQELAAVMADGKNQSKLTEFLPYGPANRSGVSLIAPERLAVTPTGPDNLPLTVVQDFAWWAEHGPEAYKRFNEWSNG